MKTTFLVAALFALTSLPYPPSFLQASADAQAVQQSSQSSAAVAAAETQPVELRSVSGELLSKLDTKTAKPGDNVVIETHDSVKTSGGAEIPSGSKLTGHVVAVQPSSGGTNSQVAVNIDRAELKNGQTLPIHSEIQSLGSSDPGAANDMGSMERPSPSSSMPSNGSASAEAGANAAGSAAAPAPGYAPGYTPGTTSQSGPVAGTIVARNGHIAIRTTSVPGVLLANNAPGEQDPRMAQASGILLGAKKDVDLDSGTKVVVGVSSSAAPQGASPE
ncbi:MAG TPA: hypothetical protein VG714_04555 [Acidobacteriaceae bacterium]|nr:hypothetical protein [Acidobacteriaceae bacterium]